MEVIKAKLAPQSGADGQAVVVSFPIADYEAVYHQLAAFGIGDPVERDCRVLEIEAVSDALKKLIGQTVNVDELDYLAKRLESFAEPEMQQFEGAAAIRGIRGIEDFINLTFCCSQVTVVTDFADLRALGRAHYLNINGGSAPVSALETLDAERLARDLLDSGKGIVTACGVVYENGMELERQYKGGAFPGYLYAYCVMAAKAQRNAATSEVTWLYLPMPEVCIHRALKRGGIDASAEAVISYEMLSVPGETFEGIDLGTVSLSEMNRVSAAIAAIGREEEMEKFCAAVGLAQPKGIDGLVELAKELEFFDFLPGINTLEAYGRYMIAESGRFLYDSELDDFYDFERYGKRRQWQETGEFLDEGYICYRGEGSLAARFGNGAPALGGGMTLA